MKCIAALGLLSVLASGEVINPGFSYIAHMADGGGVSMDITMVNLDTTANGYTVVLYADNGSLLALATDAGTNSTFSGTLAPGGSFTIHTLGTTTPQAEGWIAIQSTGTVGTSAIFHVNTPPWNGTEAMLPADSWRNYEFVLPFDHTGSVITGLALANPISNTSMNVSIAFKDTNGNVIASGTQTLGPFAHTSIVTTTAFPATVGKSGTIQITTDGAYMGVLGLRFGPTAISSILPMVNAQWVPGLSTPAPPSNPYPYFSAH